MATDEFLRELEQFRVAALAALSAAADADALETARVQFLGAKSGQLKNVQKRLGTVPADDRPQAGKRFNEVKTEVDAALAAAKVRVATGAASSKAFAPFDVTLPGKRPRLGHIHPITQTIEELKDIMGRLGFTVAGGPEVEDEWHN